MSVHSMDLTKGSVFKKLLVFSFPLVVTNFLQQLYHSADVIVVGNFAQNPTIALAAVGSTSHITSLFLQLFVGLSVGVNVVCAQRRGAGDRSSVNRVIGTSLIVAVCSGAFLATVGFCLSPQLLTWLGSPASVIGDATTYMRIIFLGQPATLIYNFGAGILRAHGDTKRSMYILTSTGILNVILNLFFVLGFHLDAAGVALATVISNYISALLMLIILLRPSGEFNMSLSDIRFHKDIFQEMIKIGAPAGINGIFFSLSNVVMTSSFNALGAISVAAVSASSSISNVVHTLVSGFTVSAVSFSGQNYGARKLERVDKLLWQGSLLVVGILLSVNVAVTVNPRFFFLFFTSDPQVIKAGIPKLLLSSWGYILYMVAEMANACQRGFGKSVMPTAINLVCICAVRLVWILAVYPHLEQTLGYLCIAYPLSWFCSMLGQLVNYYFVRKREWKKLAEERAQTAIQTA